jgi:hypothetical protein
MLGMRTGPWIIAFDSGLAYTFGYPSILGGLLSGEGSSSTGSPRAPVSVATRARMLEFEVDMCTRDLQIDIWILSSRSTPAFMRDCSICLRYVAAG